MSEVSVHTLLSSSAAWSLEDGAEQRSAKLTSSVALSPFFVVGGVVKPPVVAEGGCGDSGVFPGG